MVNYTEGVLENGLRVFIQPDFLTPMVSLNIAYDVGSKDEHKDKTGFAHLFEHLMFSGSKNAPDFDTPLQSAGGTNNAFTSVDVTNYYVQVPKANIETALWLESDRMKMLAFSEKGLEVQRKVVVEEFAQRYLNVPYGDFYLELRPSVYNENNGYNWPTIGKKVEHITDATMDDVKSFFGKYYRPNNAVICLSGPIDFEEGMALVKRWFADIEPGDIPKRDYKSFELINAPSDLILEREVPLDAFYKVYTMPGKRSNDYYKYDLVSDVLSRGDSSRFAAEITTQNDLFADLNAYVTGDWEHGLFLVGGKLNEGVSQADAEDCVERSIQKMLKEGIADTELEKLSNAIVSQHAFQNISGLNRAMLICLGAILGDANLVNTEADFYTKVTKDEILESANELFVKQTPYSFKYKALK